MYWQILFLVCPDIMYFILQHGGMFLMYFITLNLTLTLVHTSRDRLWAKSKIGQAWIYVCVCIYKCCVVCYICCAQNSSLRPLWYCWIILRKIRIKWCLLKPLCVLQKERRLLENLRLDLDACKTRLKKAKVAEAKAAVSTSYPQSPILTPTVFLVL